MCQEKSFYFRSQKALHNDLIYSFILKELENIQQNYESLCKFYRAEGKTDT